MTQKVEVIDSPTPYVITFHPRRTTSTDRGTVARTICRNARVTGRTCGGYLDSNFSTVLVIGVLQS
jgi:hypothetical protein